LSSAYPIEFINALLDRSQFTLFALCAVFSSASRSFTTCFTFFSSFFASRMSEFSTFLTSSGEVGCAWKGGWFVMGIYLEGARWRIQSFYMISPKSDARRHNPRRKYYSDQVWRNSPIKSLGDGHETCSDEISLCILTLFHRLDRRPVFYNIVYAVILISGEQCCRISHYTKTSDNSY